ncbi:MAG: Hsp20 family protein [Gemmatimonadaceae bacterium]|nr:Hsp20 family protein [Gemmatimonadaceae bacterium]
MAREKGNQQRQENLNKGPGTTPGKPSQTTAKSEIGGERGDRQRAIETGREVGMATGVTPRPATSPAYGPGASPFIAGAFPLMRRMAENMDQLFENFGFDRTGLALAPTFGAGLDRDFWRDLSAFGQAAWTPQVETFRRGDNLVVRTDLPGLRKEDVKVEIDDGMLTISGERSEEHQEERDDFYRTERSYGRFYRTLPLPEGVNADKCEAAFKDGVLELTLPAPKQPERKAKQVQIH